MFAPSVRCGLRKTAVRTMNSNHRFIHITTSNLNPGVRYEIMRSRVETIRCIARWVGWGKTKLSQYLDQKFMSNNFYSQGQSAYRWDRDYKTTGLVVANWRATDSIPNVPDLKEAQCAVDGAGTATQDGTLVRNGQRAQMDGLKMLWRGNFFVPSCPGIIATLSAL